MGRSKMIEQPLPPITLVAASDARRRNAYEQFLTELRNRGAADIAFIEGPLAEAPAHGFVLLDADADTSSRIEKLDPITRQSLSPRIVLMRARRGTLHQDLEQYQLAAAIEEFRYFHWQTHPASGDGEGVYGRKEVAASLGADCIGGSPAETDHYCLIRSSRFVDLPSLLAGYLREYAALFKIC